MAVGPVPAREAITSADVGDPAIVGTDRCEAEAALTCGYGDLCRMGGRARGVRLRVKKEWFEVLWKPARQPRRLDGKR